MERGHKSPPDLTCPARNCSSGTTMILLLPGGWNWTQPWTTVRLSVLAVPQRPLTRCAHLFLPPLTLRRSTGHRSAREQPLPLPAAGAGRVWAGVLAGPHLHPGGKDPGGGTSRGGVWPFAHRAGASPSPPATPRLCSRLAHCSPGRLLWGPLLPA